MLKRQARERREYLFKKSVEDKESAVHERKKRLKEYIDAGKPIPSELRKDEAELRKQIELDDERTEQLVTSRDNEYRWAGVEDPRVVVTTSRDPSSRLKQFAKEVRLVFPNAQRMNRGGHVLEELVKICQQNEMTDLVIVHEHRGEPDGLIVSHLPHGPTAFFSLSNCVMRHDIPNAGTMSEAFPHLIFHNFKTTLGHRARDILKYLFPVPKDDSKRVMTFFNNEDSISFRHHVYTKAGGKDVELAEVGPRFEMKLYQIKIGTVDQEEAEVEFAARHYTNTARKRKYI
eukprot:m.235284 g.235284  ORF g.235284 m.235284 type:complete len:288 (-) comp12797_c0_seq1:152-1015(-)